MVGGSNVKIKPECVLYSFVGRPRIIYEIIQIFQFIVSITLLFTFILYKFQLLFSNIDS